MASFGGQGVPRTASAVEQVVVVDVDAVAELVFSEPVPKAFNLVEFRRIRFKEAETISIAAQDSFYVLVRLML